MNRKLTVFDEGNVVKAELEEDGRKCLDYINEKSKDVRIVSPLPVKKILIDNFKYFADGDLEKPTVKDQVNFYIKCREKTVFDEIQKIRKSMKRIQRQLKCIEIANEVLLEYELGNPGRLG